jgi:hypothetical protein
LEWSKTVGIVAASDAIGRSLFGVVRILMKIVLFGVVRSKCQKSDAVRILGFYSSREYRKPGASSESIVRRPAWGRTIVCSLPGDRCMEIAVIT